MAASLGFNSMTRVGPCLAHLCDLNKSREIHFNLAQCRQVKISPTLHRAAALTYIHV
jgi:hypothetical protein